MLAIEQLQQMLTELGSLMDLSAVAEFEDGTGWGLVVDEETSLTIDYDAAGARLMLSVEIAEPSTGNLLKLYEMLLVYNGLWDQTGGLSMSLDAPGGTVMMSLALGTDGLNPNKLADIVSGFLEIRQGWIEILATNPKDSSDNVLPDPPPGGIRV